MSSIVESNDANCFGYEINNDTLFLLFAILFYAGFAGFGVYYLLSTADDVFNKLARKRLYIIRRLSFMGLDKKIREVIQENARHNYRILSTYDLFERDERFDVRNIGKYSSIVLQSFMRLLERGNKDIYLMNRNLYRWEYEPYVVLAKIFGYEPIILEFISSTDTVDQVLERLKTNEPLQYVTAMNDIRNYEIDNRFTYKRIGV
jgi:hypothetical protein